LQKKAKKNIQEAIDGGREIPDDELLFIHRKKNCCWNCGGDHYVKMQKTS
jgi:hypothetical protein